MNDLASHVVTCDLSHHQLLSLIVVVLALGHIAWSLTPALFALCIVRSLTPALRTVSYLEHHRDPGIPTPLLLQPTVGTLCIDPGAFFNILLIPFPLNCTSIPFNTLEPLPTSSYTHTSLTSTYRHSFHGFPLLKFIFGIATSYFLRFSVFSGSEPSCAVAFSGIFTGNLCKARCVFPSLWKKENDAETDTLICRFSSTM